MTDIDPDQLLDHIGVEINFRPNMHCSLGEYLIKIGEQTVKIHIGVVSFKVEEEGTKIDFYVESGQMLAIFDCVSDLACGYLWGDRLDEALSRAMTLLNLIQSHHTERIATILNEIRTKRPYF